MNEDSTVESGTTAPPKPFHRAFAVGLYTGMSLAVVTLGSLVVANRIPALERYALERNAVFYGLFIAILLYPVCRFPRRPKQMIVAALTGWAMFVAAYNLAGWYFRNLFQVLRTPLEAFVEGMAVYGVFAVALWVGSMLLRARRFPILPGHGRAPHVATHDHRDSAW
jgi:hypothetical protein